MIVSWDRSVGAHKWGRHGVVGAPAPGTKWDAMQASPKCKETPVRHPLYLQLPGLLFCLEKHGWGGAEAEQTGLLGLGKAHVGGSGGSWQVLQGSVGSPPPLPLSHRDPTWKSCSHWEKPQEWAEMVRGQSKSYLLLGKPELINGMAGLYLKQTKKNLI